MAETRTPRFDLPQWADEETDGPSMEDFNEAFLNIESGALKFGLGTIAARPAPEVGMLYFVAGEVGATAYKNGEVHYSIGGSWLTLNREEVGSIKMWPTGVEPEGGWAIIAGQTLNRVTFAALFAKIGTVFNIGGEAGTDFRLPDFRGRSPLGVAAVTGFALGNSDGEATIATRVTKWNHTHSHTIAVADTGHSHTATPAGAQAIESSSSGSHTHTGTTNAAGVHVHSVDQKITQKGTGSDIRVFQDLVSETNGAGSHTHTLSVVAGGSHTHTINTSDHTHTISTTAQTHSHGGATGATVDYKHPYQAINFVIKY